MESHNALFGSLDVIHNLLVYILDRYKLIEFVTHILFSHVGCQGYDVWVTLSEESV